MSLGDAGWVAGFLKVPGRNASYRAGVNGLEACIVHYTAGRYVNDRVVGINGFFNAYAPKDHPGEQYAPIDARTAHACEWNPRATSLEVEKLSDAETMNDHQVETCGLWVARCIALGIAPTYFDSPKAVKVGAPLPAGFISHRSLDEVACDDHTDYWTQDEWRRILAAAQGTRKDHGMFIADENGGAGRTRLVSPAGWTIEFTGARGVPYNLRADTLPWLVKGTNVGYAVVTTAQMDAYPKAVASGGGAALPVDWVKQVEDAAFRGAQRAEDV